MNIKIICVGKLKERFYAEACCEYAKRLGAFCRLEICELAEVRTGQNPSEAELQRALELEGARILERVTQPFFAFCIEGEMQSSESLARLVQKSGSSLSFVIGGSNGLCQEVKNRAAARLSMSPMTFPHHLARVMALEQLYRAFCINEGRRYHK